MPTRDDKGRWRNKDGKFVHEGMVQVDKKLEDELVDSMLTDAIELQRKIQEFKTKAFAQCYDFNDLLRQEYDLARITSKSGAVTLKTFDGTAEVTIQVAKLIVFDQKLTLAKEKIDEYLDEKTENADSEIKTLITRVFDVKNGKIDAKQILSLKSYPITHKKWQEAMKMIDEATEIAGTKSYIRFRQRKGKLIDGAMESVVLDIAKLEILDDKKEEEK